MYRLDFLIDLALDVGFATYVSYLHIEVAHTHPVMLGQSILSKLVWLFIDLCI